MWAIFSVLFLRKKLQLDWGTVPVQSPCSTARHVTTGNYVWCIRDRDDTGFKWQVGIRSVPICQPDLGSAYDHHVSAYTLTKKRGIRAHAAVLTAGGGGGQKWSLELRIWDQAGSTER